MESNIFAFGFVFSNFRNSAQIKKEIKTTNNNNLSNRIKAARNSPPPPPIGWGIVGFMDRTRVLTDSLSTLCMHVVFGYWGMITLV